MRRRRRSSSRPGAGPCRGPVRALRRAPSAGRSRGSAAPPYRRARRTDRWPPAASPDPRTTRTRPLMKRSRKTFSRTCCGSVRSSSTGRSASSFETTLGMLAGELRRIDAGPHVEGHRADAGRPGDTGGRRAAEQDPSRRCTSRSSPGRRFRCPGRSCGWRRCSCACRRQSRPRLNFFANSSFTIATFGALAASAGVNSRPASSAMPSVLKYPGPTSL